jgi:ribosome maturation protein SDO1
MTLRVGRERVHLNLARLKKKGETFEVDVDPDLALKLRSGAEVDLRQVLKAETVFKDAQKGLVASETLMNELFGTSDAVEVASVIIKEGEIQLTSEYRAQLRETKKRRIIEIIHRNGIDPRSKLPHPAARIEAAMEEAKIKIDEHRRAEDQVKSIVAELQVVLPVTFAKKEILVKIPASHAPKTYSTVKSMSNIIQEKWQNDGSWEAVVEIPGGLEEEFHDKLNKATRGEVETKVIREKE